MGKSKLMVTHPDITYDSLGEYLMRQRSLRIGLRVAVLRGVMDGVPINKLSRRCNISRQGIYNLVRKVNEEGMKGLEGKSSGRPCKLTAEIEKILRELSFQSPMKWGYGEFRWNNSLVRKYLEEKYNIHIGPSQLINWLRIINSPVELVRRDHKKLKNSLDKSFYL